MWPEALAAFDDLVEVKVVLDGDELMGEGNCMHGKLLFEKIVAVPDSRWKLVSIRTLCGEGDPLAPRSTLTRKLFLSTPSARRATVPARG